VVFRAGQDTPGGDATAAVGRVFDEASLAEFEQVGVELAFAPWAAPAGIQLGKFEPVRLEPGRPFWWNRSCNNAHPPRTSSRSERAIATAISSGLWVILILSRK
jgi:hypothetical protein